MGGPGCRFGPVPKRSDTLCADRPVLSANVFEYTVEIQRRESHYGKRFVKGVFPMSHQKSKHDPILKTFLTAFISITAFVHLQHR